MPVKRLERFSEITPGILVDLNLKELIKQELFNTGDRPTIVIDGSSLSFVFNYNESLDILKQPALIKTKIENFVKKIISFGANVIVVLRGSSEKNPDAWFDKENYSLGCRRKQCQTLKEPESIYDRTVKAASFFCCNETLASISSEHYTFFAAVNGTAKEVAETAVKEKCLAVLGQDSNYLIYEGIRFYIPLKSLDVETFNCKCYDRNELLKCLGLKSYQLPMFATLCGNDVILFLTLQSFHLRTSGLKFDKHLRSLAEKVKNTPEDPYSCIQEMVNLIGHKEVTESVISKSLDFYLKREEYRPDNELLKFALERLRQHHWNRKLYVIFVRHVYYSKGVTDICNVGLAAFEILRPLRKKLYGILFPSQEVYIEEYFLEEMLLRNFKSAIPKTVCKISSPENPGLIALFENRTPKMNFVRWELFLSCVSETLRLSDIRIVPQVYLIPVMALHYLHVTIQSHFREKKILKQKIEVEALLVGVLLFKEFPRERLEDVKDSVPDLWELQLNNLYLDVCFALLLLNQACGYAISRQNACICNFYDGKLTHWIFNEMKRGATCDEFFEGNIVLGTLFDTLLDIIKT